MEILLASVVLVFILVVFVNEFYQARLGVPCMPTTGRVRAAMLSEIMGPQREIVELGSGWGGLAMAAALSHPDARVTGLELSFFPHLFSRARLLLHPSLKNLSFLRRDFFGYPLHDATTVLCYLTNPLMAKLKDKLEKELPQGARVISSTFFIPGWEPEKTREIKGVWNTRIFVYRKT